MYETTTLVGLEGRQAPAGIRIRPGKEETARRLHTDQYQVWDHARSYGAATQALLVEWRKGFAK
ncbi:hypothetical protein ACIQZO_19785 [Streptomyces sp. NPDC097617]|uniref:hypothetical protein n=1 Tax=Streptomyces sp. NPDC097617 TaxID=3366091 RepID=UPI00381BC000